jgi:hypothetical protein
MSQKERTGNVVPVWAVELVLTSHNSLKQNGITFVIERRVAAKPLRRKQVRLYTKNRQQENNAQNIHNDTAGPHIDLFGVTFALKDFRSDVTRGSTSSRHHLLSVNFGQPKICNFNGVVSLVAQQKIFRL